MNWKRRILALVLAMGMSLSLAACSSNTANTDQTDQDTTPAQGENTGNTGNTSGSETGDNRTVYPLTITTYNYDREPVEYTFEKAPERVYAYAQDNIEILLSLGLADKIVAASGMDGEIDPDLADEFATIDYHDTGVLPREDVIALEPDFITGWYSSFSDDRLGDVDFWHSSATVC